MNITIMRTTRRGNSSTYNAAKFFISKLHDVGEVYEFKKIEKNSKYLKPSFHVKMLYSMFSYLHLNDKMWEIDNKYWKENFEKLKGGKSHE